MTGKAVHGRELGLRLAQALGLDPTTVVSITIHTQCDELASVTVRHIMHDDPTLTSIFTDYQLVEKQ